MEVKFEEPRMSRMTRMHEMDKTPNDPSGTSTANLYLRSYLAHTSPERDGVRFVGGEQQRGTLIGANRR
jgi:hypothetical protein